MITRAANGTHRIALGIEYDGSDFQGWQIQPHGPSVQAVLEQALARVADVPIRVQCAGRTDSGVHATWQVVHFDSPVQRSERSWVLGANSNLPDTASALWAKPVAADFHARYSATARRYRYVILNRRVRSALWHRRALWERQPLNVAAMARAAQPLLGEHDFSSFRAAACQAKTPRRNVHSITVMRHNQLVVVDVCANAFLHNMIRIVVGTLMKVGYGEASEAWPGEILASRDRLQAAVTVPSDGLYLVGVRYPDEFGLPRARTGARAPTGRGWN